MLSPPFVPSRIPIGLVLIFLLCSRPTLAQTTVTAGADLLFYADNTEFANPFREGETLLGTAGRLFFDVKLNETVTLRGGFFGNGRYGSHRFLEHAEPWITLQLSRGPSRLVFGSLETRAWAHDTTGPDEETPHRLLPPLEREQLTFTRAHEMGLQWIVDAPRVQQDTWINWQRLNTPAHRERFDAGHRSQLALGRGLSLHGQWHIVHEGGQQFASGPVRDSQAAALGAGFVQRVRTTRISGELYSVVTREAPDRGRADSGETGIGMFARGTIERAGWRGHLIVWRSWDALKEEGDANYLMLRRDGSVFRKVRDYGEVGLTRHFVPAPGVRVDASVRVHRVESHYQYAYRITARVSLRHPF